uniref:HAT C-terminal dimerisation domain-containing protein n=1 Tax=Monopterus albus TaxID=43700 RepID=A0A3Q3QTL4_MONAL
QTDGESDKPKQQKLSFSRSAIMPFESREVRRLVAEYVVEHMLPLSTVESPLFRKLVGKIPVTSTSEKLKKTIDEQQYVSTIADIWTAYNKSFLGVTVHWINSETLQWKKAAIACHRFRGRHTYDAIASELEDIFSQYGLTDEKVTACVTGNDSNFVKAFKEHQQVESEDEEEEVEEDDGEVAFTDLHSILNGGYDEDAQQGLCVLPAHFRCAAHTLNIIANNEIDKWLSSNPESRAVYRSSTAKCLALWTKVASECLEKISERKLIVPSVTRWNSFYGKALLAAVSLPKFKLRWVKEETRRDHIKYLLTTECCSLTAEDALVERLFSLGSLVLTPKRNRLGDRRFQHLILMLILSMDLYNFCFDLTLS